MHLALWIGVRNSDLFKVWLESCWSERLEMQRQVDVSHFKLQGIGELKLATTSKKFIYQEDSSFAAILGDPVEWSSLKVFEKNDRKCNVALSWYEYTGISCFVVEAYMQVQKYYWFEALPRPSGRRGGGCGATLWLIRSYLVEFFKSQFFGQGLSPSVFAFVY